VPLGYLQELAGYRADGYDWRKHEARLNQHPSSPPPSTASPSTSSGPLPRAPGDPAAAHPRLARLGHRPPDRPDGPRRGGGRRFHLLTNVSIYRLTGTAGSSAGHYYETAHDPMMWAPRERGTVPTGVAVSRTQDVAIRRLAERDHNVVHWSEFDRGGHFAATEAPEFLVGDVRALLRKLGER